VKKIFLAAAVAVAALFGSIAAPAQAEQAKSWDIDEVMGKPDAPITFYEYSSLTCPHCADFHAKTFPQIKSEWIDTGKAKLIYRDFPLDPLAQAAAMVSHCSGDRYFAFINTFFHAQQQWATAPQPLAAIKTIAKLGGMNEDQVDKCLADRGLLNEINARKEEGVQKFGIDSTPSFIIGGKLYSGEMSYDQFAKLLSQSK